jgi:predicted O-linked N-acetylglucosamine transferase (SPINDLY family)
MTDSTSSLFNQALALHQAGRRDEAQALYQAVLVADAGHTDCLTSLGTLLLQRGDRAGCLRLLDHSLTLDPAQPTAHFNRGIALKGLERPTEALASYQRAIELKPDYAEGYNNLGNVLKELDRLDDALACLDRAIALRPAYARAHFNRGETLRALRRYPDALDSFRRAAELKPDFAEALVGQAFIHQLMNNFPEALALHERGLKLKPDLPYVVGGKLHIKMHCCNWDALEADYAALDETIRLGNQPAEPFFALPYPSSPDMQQACARTYGQHKYPAAPPLWTGERYDHERVRIGYFSADFHDHATAHLIAGLFEHHDRRRFELVAFSFGPDARDRWRERLAASFDRFLDVRDWTAAEIAAKARELEIDIAVDLKGYTMDARTNVFAQRPAPVQVSYLGYPGTLGVPYFDYLVADPVLIPPEHQLWYDEKIVYMPHSYQVNDATKVIAERTFSRAELGLPDDAFVFCCFNANYKITPDLFDIWMRLLAAVPGSVLWLLDGHPVATGNLRKEAGKRGVDPARLVFASRLPLPEHLARHRQADLFLDTFHYNAHTTASDALWAGLPVLTCLGNTFPGRVAASLLNAVGLPELITRDHAGYEALALELARNPEQLRALREKLAANRLTQPLFDTALFTRHLEAAYLAMQARHEAGLGPDRIVVEDSGGA